MILAVSICSIQVMEPFWTSDHCTTDFDVFWKMKRGSSKTRFPPPCFTVGMVFLGLYSAFLFLQTRQVELMPNSSIFVSSDHITFFQASSGSSRCSWANFRWACTCPRSRILIHSVVYYWWFCDCGPKCLQVINKLLLCSNVLIPDLSHHHWYPTRRDLAWSPRPREIGGDFVFLTFSNNCSNS